MICPYCKSEVVVGTAYDALSKFTASFSEQAQKGQQNTGTKKTDRITLNKDVVDEVDDLKEAFQGGSAEDIKGKMDDLRETIGELAEQQSFPGLSFSYVFKSCPHCGSSVQVTDESGDVTECPHCGYVKGNGAKNG